MLQAVVKVEYQFEMLAPKFAVVVCVSVLKGHAVLATKRPPPKTGQPGAAGAMAISTSERRRRVLGVDAPFSQRFEFNVIFRFAQGMPSIRL